LFTLIWVSSSKRKKSPYEEKNQLDTQISLLPKQKKKVQTLQFNVERCGGQVGKKKIWWPPHHPL